MIARKQRDLAHLRPGEFKERFSHAHMLQQGQIGS
jgi:hypothetical protein